VGDDQLIGTGGTNASGFFSITLIRALVAGEQIYPVDTCQAGGLVGPIVTVARSAPAPAMSPAMIVVLSAVLSLVGIYGLTRVRWGR
jgi:hypothetical protein